MRPDICVQFWKNLHAQGLREPRGLALGTRAPRQRRAKGLQPQEKAYGCSRSHPGQRTGREGIRKVSLVKGDGRTNASRPRETERRSTEDGLSGSAMG